MFYCGIDVAKAKHTAVVIDDAGAIVVPAFNFENSRDGFTEFDARLAGLDGDVTVGVEATGHYWLALYEHVGRSRQLMVLNPLQVATYRKNGIRKCKTDKTDAVWIADLMRIGHVTPAAVPMDTILQMREMTRFRHHLTEVISDCKRKVLSVLDRVFPEYESLFSNVFVAASRKLLSMTADPQELAEFDLTELSNVLKKASRGRMSKTKAQEIQDAARTSIGVGFLADAARIEIGCLIAQIELLLEQRTLVDAKIEEFMETFSTHITTISGIGNVTGAKILAEIGDVNRFESLEQLVAYAGIDASVYQTGQFTATRAHVSKRGSPYLRHALWLAASMSVLSDPEMKAYYAKRRAEGKAHGTTIGAVCRKMLARIYVVLREDRPYEVRAS